MSERAADYALVNKASLLAAAHAQSQESSRSDTHSLTAAKVLHYTYRAVFHNFMRLSTFTLSRASFHLSIHYGQGPIHTDTIHQVVAVTPANAL